MYIEGNSVTYGDSARLLSSSCLYNGPVCLEFWYHMFGSATAMALNIYLLKDNRATKVWVAKNNRGPMWHPAQIDISAAAPFQVNLILNRDVSMQLCRSNPRALTHPFYTSSRSSWKQFEALMLNQMWPLMTFPSTLAHAQVIFYLQLTLFPSKLLLIMMNFNSLSLTSFRRFSSHGN